ncbi:MAG: SPOR domain-containing protein [Bacillota bacterium]
MGKRSDRRKNKSNNFRFIILLILLSMIAIFIGFQVGNSFFASQMESDQEEMEIYEAVPESEDIEEDEIEEDVTNEEIVTPGEENEISGEEVLDDSEDNEAMEETNSDTTENDAEFYIQVGAFGNGENADNLLEDLEGRGFQGRINGSEPYRVQIVGGNTRDDAEEIANELQSLGFETLIITE